MLRNLKTLKVISGAIPTMIYPNDNSILGRILIVDDCLDNLNFLAEMLKSYGYLTIKAENAEIARIKTESEHPDLILLDIVMPGMDGYEFCKTLKYNPNNSDIPIIFMSALDELFDKIKAFKV